MIMESNSNGGPPLLSPQPQRPFYRKISSSSLSSDRSLSSNHSDKVSTPTSHSVSSTAEENSLRQPGEKITKSRSIANLTGSTLFGIYAPTALNEPSSSQQTPWGTGAQTPATHEGLEKMGALSPPQTRGVPNGDDITRRLNIRASQSHGVRPNIGKQVAVTRPSTTQIISRSLVLFFFGVVYGGIVSHLHSSRTIGSVQIRKNDIYESDGATILYISAWGIAGIIMGNLLPWIDEQSSKPDEESAPKVSVGWSDAIRGVGSFVGVAFAIRRLPWETTLQLAITLSLANPLLWYLLDRTSSGLLLSTAVGLAGTAILLATNPLLIPAPTLPTGIPITAAAGNSYNINSSYTSPITQPIPGQDAHYDTVATASWIASVLFCSCVCFGSIGRLLNSSNVVPRRRSVNDDERSRSRGRG